MSLEWPSDFDRTDSDQREPYPHNFRVSRRDAFTNIVNQVDRLAGAHNLSIETAADHRRDDPNIPKPGSSPSDPGIVVRFERDGATYTMPCDRWVSLRDNAQAVAKYIEAKRALDRYGVETLESEFVTGKERID